MPELLRRNGFFVIMLLVAAALVGAGLVDQQREAADALAELRVEQARFADAVAAYLAEEVRGRAGPTDVVAREALSGLQRFHEPGETLVVLTPPRGPGDAGAPFVTDDGRVVSNETLRLAALRDETSATLPRDESASFGLPRRMAVAGLARFETRQGPWGVVALTSARRLRDRVQFAAWRFALGAGVVGASVAGVAAWALRRQRRELELAARLRVEELAREQEQALLRADKMATLAALSTGVAHEIATPLAVLDATIDEVGRRAPEHAAALEAMSSQTRRIERVVRGFLSLARGEAPALERTSAAEVLRNAAELVRFRFTEGGVALRVVEAAPGEDAWLACDPPLLEQAVVNLLSNACDASSSGGEVRAFVETGPRHARLVVEDAGPGLREEEAARATAPFYTTKAGAGTGLGLTIATEIARHHGGALSLEPRPDGARGLRATLELPLAEAP